MRCNFIQNYSSYLCALNLEVKAGQSEEFAEISKCRWILPSLDYDGFFIAKLRKLC